MQTNFSTVIGGYNPDQWEDTTGMKSSNGYSDRKDIVSGKPFLFYWVNDQIEIIKHRDDKIPTMSSDKYALMEFGNGLFIHADENKLSSAELLPYDWVLP